MLTKCFVFTSYTFIKPDMYFAVGSNIFILICQHVCIIIHIYIYVCIYASLLYRKLIYCIPTHNTHTEPRWCFQLPESNSSHLSEHHSVAWLLYSFASVYTFWVYTHKLFVQCMRCECACVVHERVHTHYIIIILSSIIFTFISIINILFYYICTQTYTSILAWALCIYESILVPVRLLHVHTHTDIHLLLAQLDITSHH